MRFFIKSVGDKHLDKVTPLDIEGLKADRLKRVKTISVNIDLRTIKAIFGLAVRWQIKLLKHKNILLLYYRS
jgi:transcriptional regulator of met regulon